MIKLLSEMSMSEVYKLIAILFLFVILCLVLIFKIAEHNNFTLPASEFSFRIVSTIFGMFGICLIGDAIFKFFLKIDGGSERLMLQGSSMPSLVSLLFVPFFSVIVVIVFFALMHDVKEELENMIYKLFSEKKTDRKADRPEDKL